MKITELLKKKMTLSFEVFPPKDAVSMDRVLDSLSHLYQFKPDFISCTYGAGGSGAVRNIDLCNVIQKSKNLVMPHFTCIDSSKEQILSLASKYVDMGIENVLALRGDFPAGRDNTGGDFSHADELLGFLSPQFPQLCFAAAAYPEKHILAPSIEADINHLRSKQDKGAQFIMSQLCYDVSAYDRFMERIHKTGITIPLVAGIMPVFAVEPTMRMTLFNGCSIPAELAAIMGKYQNDPESFTKAGMDYTVDLIHRFISQGINGLHLYSMNKWKKLTQILKAAGISN